MSSRLIPKKIGLWKLEIGPANCIYSYPECALQYIGHLASGNIVVEIWEDTCKVSFVDFWSSIDLVIGHWTSEIGIYRTHSFRKYCG